MTKSEIEKLIEYLQSDLPKTLVDEHAIVGEKTNVSKAGIYCKVGTLFDLLREYPTELEKTCGPGEGKTEVTLLLDGDATPLNLAKAIIDSGLLYRGQLGEMIAYLDVYFNYHSDGGYRNDL